MMPIYCQEIRASSRDFFSVPKSVARAIHARDFTAASSRRDRRGDPDRIDARSSSPKAAASSWRRSHRHDAGARHARR